MTFWQHSALHSPGCCWPSRPCCCHRFNLLSTRIPRSLSAKLLSNWSVPSPSVAWVYSSSGTRPCIKAYLPMFSKI